MSTLATVILVILLLAVFGALPTWPHSASWGPWPSSGLGLLLIVILVLALAGRL